MSTCERRCGSHDEHPVLIDDFLQNAVEIDVDAVCDGKDVLIGAIMEHIEEAGIHSGDSACMIPPQTLPGVRAGGGQGLCAEDRSGPGSRRHREPADGLQGRHGLCPGGKPKLQQNHTLRLQVGGPAAGQDRRQVMIGTLLPSRGTRRSQSCPTSLSKKFCCPSTSFREQTSCLGRR